MLFYNATHLNTNIITGGSLIGNSTMKAQYNCIMKLILKIHLNCNRDIEIHVEGSNGLFIETWTSPLRGITMKNC